MLLNVPATPAGPLNFTKLSYCLPWFSSKIFIILLPADKVLIGLKLKNRKLSGGSCCGLVLGSAVGSAE